METPEKLKEIVKEKYGAIARSEVAGCGSGCGCGAPAGASFAEGYDRLPGYLPEADLGLGCGLPLEGAGIQPGHTVVDLGSGAGNDAFVARSLVGDRGHVIGVDMTEDMVEKARANNRNLGHANVEFRLGEIENLPVASGTADIVISNCVLNLVPDKARAFAEIFRVLKPGGRISISDIVLTAPLPEALRGAAELYTGCVAGALPREEYLDILRAAGFSGIQVARERVLSLPDEIVAEHLGEDQREAFRREGARILSVTVQAAKGRHQDG